MATFARLRRGKLALLCHRSCPSENQRLTNGANGYWRGAEVLTGQERAGKNFVPFCALVAC